MNAVFYSINCVDKILILLNRVSEDVVLVEQHSRKCVPHLISSFRCPVYVHNKHV